MEKDTLPALVDEIAGLLASRGLRLSAAESCTGGWIAKLCTDLCGSSDWFECGFVTYSNEAKQEMLEVSDLTLDSYGAVSEEVAAEMVRGAIANSRAEAAVSVTGIAGPGGATETKPVGMVCFGWLVPDQGVKTATMNFDGDREAVRRQAAEHSLQVLSGLLR
ncbi:MAG: Damage-inducible protein CinA [uncultured Thiotrichaceae bacterium]|uniref:Damage-inducible protein CinA n=1 Tax=uncultured Thiotrichaceae bacterium TaxID=298394 RepID=A0A6S6SKV9_9GAMM|nr:MAG: Damage-inducible protein CinA [uncultured Thiotrichaceae bacterium]